MIKYFHGLKQSKSLAQVTREIVFLRRSINTEHKFNAGLASADCRNLAMSSWLTNCPGCSNWFSSALKSLATVSSRAASEALFSSSSLTTDSKTPSLSFDSFLEGTSLSLAGGHWSTFLWKGGFHLFSLQFCQRLSTSAAVLRIGTGSAGGRRSSTRTCQGSIWTGSRL